MTGSRWDGFADRASARRAAARRLHPDLGGDGQQLADALADIDRWFGTRSGPEHSTPIRITVRHGSGRGPLRAVQKVYRMTQKMTRNQTRNRLPLKRRRYVSL